MRKKSYKGRCEKRMLSKCESVCRTYDPIQTAYAEVLERDPGIIEIQCNVVLEDLESGMYVSDFLCTKSLFHSSYFFVQISGTLIRIFNLKFFS